MIDGKTENLFDITQVKIFPILKAALGNLC